MITILILIINYLIFEIYIYLFLKKYKQIKWLIFNQTINFDYEKFKNFKKNVYDERLGWDFRYSKKNKNFISHKGFRRSSYANRTCKILAFGDSYTFGKQVKNDQTWEEIISKEKDTFVANYGVGNYGLDQAFLKFNKIKKHKNNKAVIFGFVPETICRVQSSWKNFLEFGNIHGFKPCVKLTNRKLKFHKNFLKRNIPYSQVLNLVNKIKNKDRFYKEKFLKYNFSFPYFFSFTKNLFFNLEIFTKIIFNNTKNISSIEEKIFPIIMKYNIKLSHLLYNEDYSRKLMHELITHIFCELKKKKIRSILCRFSSTF